MGNMSKIRRRILAALVATVIAVGLAGPAYALATPYVNLYKNTNYGTFVWSGGGTGCFSLSGTSAMNVASSLTAHNLKQAISGGYAYWSVDFYDHADCTGYFGFTLNGRNGSSQYTPSLVYYPCYCNDRISGVKIYRS